MAGGTVLVWTPVTVAFVDHATAAPYKYLQEWLCKSAGCWCCSQLIGLNVLGCTHGSLLV